MGCMTAGIGNQMEKKVENDMDTGFPQGLALYNTLT